MARGNGLALQRGGSGWIPGDAALASGVMEAPPGPPAPPGQDHGRACTVALGVTVILIAATAAVLVASGMPTDARTPTGILVATFGGFAFCGGQAAMITGFMAMKQRQNPLWVLPALVGALLGVGAFLGMMGLFMYIGATQAGFRF